MNDSRSTSTEDSKPERKQDTVDAHQPVTIEPGAPQLTMPLTIDTVYIWHDGPILYTATDADGRRALVQDVAGGHDENWEVLVGIAEGDIALQQLAELENNQHPINAAFDHSLGWPVAHITLYRMRDGGDITIAGVSNPIPKEWLNAAGATVGEPFEPS